MDVDFGSLTGLQFVHTAGANYIDIPVSVRPATDQTLKAFQITLGPLPAGTCLNCRGRGHNWEGCTSITGIPLTRQLVAFARLKEQGFTSDRPIVIGAGEGTTGTRTLTKLSHDLGLRAAHCLICTADLSKIGRRMTAIHPSNYSTTNWPAFLTKYDAVFDTPVSALFPVLFAAFPNARVVHSVRASLEWSMRRDEKHRRGPGPLAFFFASDPRLAHKPNKLRTDPKRRKKANSSSADAPTAAPWAVHAAATRIMERAAALTCLLAAGTHT